MEHALKGGAGLSSNGRETDVFQFHEEKPILPGQAGSTPN